MKNCIDCGCIILNNDYIIPCNHFNTKKCSYKTYLKKKGVKNFIEEEKEMIRDEIKEQNPW